MKTLISLLLASSSLLALTGCGETDDVSLDKTVISRADTNQTNYGGYWYTYVDRAIDAVPASAVVPNTGKLDPTNPVATELYPGLGPNNGIETEEGNQVFHVTGIVRPEPQWAANDTLNLTGQSGDAADTYNWKDPYWDAFYAGSSKCPGTSCEEVKYPTAGLGFGLSSKNATTDLSAFVGVGFRIKLGAGNGGSVGLAIPMDLTDVPDPSYGDMFGDMGAGITYNGVSVPGPYCEFPAEIDPTTTTRYGSATKTCFKNMTAVIPNQVAGSWSVNCMAWGDFAPPGWGGPVLNVDGSTVETLLPSRIVKMQFEAPKPTPTDPATAFDFYVDDVVLLDCANWAERCGAVAMPPAVVAACSGAAPAGG